MTADELKQCDEAFEKWSIDHASGFSGLLYKVWIAAWAAKPPQTVSREAIEDCILETIQEATGESPSMDEEADAWLFSSKVYALQLPTPQTSVPIPTVEIEPYLWHKRNCKSLTQAHYLGDPSIPFPCDCGLEVLTARLKGANHE